jgi:predicted amidophosphoribosyltransferase
MEELNGFLTTTQWNIMLLTQCPECKKDVSSQATTCPHCGFPLTANQDKTKQKPESALWILENFKSKIQDKAIFFGSM